MKRYLLLLLFVGLLAAQNVTPNLGFSVPPHGTPNWDYNVNSNFQMLDQYLSGLSPVPALQLSGYVSPGKTIVSRLSLILNPPVGALVYVTDGTSQSDCTVGGASSGDLVLCQWTGLVGWVAFGGSGGGGGFSASVDLSGNSTAQHVVGFNTHPLDTTQTPNANGQFWQWSVGANKYQLSTVVGILGYAPAGTVSCSTGLYLSTTTTAGGTCAQVQYSQLAGAPTNLPPNGAAGGDLSGTFPNPGVAQINGAAMPQGATLLGTNSSRQPISQTGNIPNNTSGTAGNLSGTPTLPNGTKAITQSTSDSTQNLATTAFVHNSLPSATSTTINAALANPTGLVMVADGTTDNCAAANAIAAAVPAGGAMYLPVGAAKYHFNSATSGCTTGWLATRNDIRVYGDGRGFDNGTTFVGGTTVDISMFAQGHTAVDFDNISVDLQGTIFDTCFASGSAAVGTMNWVVHDTGCIGSTHIGHGVLAQSGIINLIYNNYSRSVFDGVAIRSGNTIAYGNTCTDCQSMTIKAADPSGSVADVWMAGSTIKGSSAGSAGESGGLSVTANSSDVLMSSIVVEGVTCTNAEFCFSINTSNSGQIASLVAHGITGDHIGSSGTGAFIYASDDGTGTIGDASIDDAHVTFMSGNAFQNSSQSTTISLSNYFANGITSGVYMVGSFAAPHISGLNLATGNANDADYFCNSGVAGQTTMTCGSNYYAGSNLLGRTQITYGATIAGGASGIGFFGSTAAGSRNGQTMAEVGWLNNAGVLHMNNYDSVIPSGTQGIHLSPQSDADNSEFSIYGDNAARSVHNWTITKGGNAGFSGIIDTAANPAVAGYMRLSFGDPINWRDVGNSADISLGPDGSGNLDIGASPIVTDTRLASPVAIGNVTPAPSIAATAVQIAGQPANANNNLTQIDTAGNVSNDPNTLDTNSQMQFLHAQGLLATGLGLTGPGAGNWNQQFGTLQPQKGSGVDFGADTTGTYYQILWPQTAAGATAGMAYNVASVTAGLSGPVVRMQFSNIGGISGSGTTNFFSKFTASGVIGNSGVQEVGGVWSTTDNVDLHAVPSFITPELASDPASPVQAQSWLNTTYLGLNAVPGFVDNATAPNKLVTPIHYAIDDDAQNLYQLQYTPKCFAALEKSIANTYCVLAFVGDSDTAGISITQSAITEMTNMMQSPSTGWGYGGPGFLTVGNAKNIMPAGTVLTLSGTWNICAWTTGSITNGHSGACWGPDNQDATSSTQNNFVQWSTSGTSVWTDCFVYYAKQASGGSFKTSIDGVDGSVISTSGSGIGSTACSHQTSGTHTLKAIVTTTSGNITILGTILVNASSTGVVVLKMAAASNTAANFVTNPNYSTLMTQIQTDLSGLSGFATGVSLWSQQWGANEWGQSLTPASLITAMTSLNTSHIGASANADYLVITDNDDEQTGTTNSLGLSMWQYDYAHQQFANKNKYAFLSTFRHTYPARTALCGVLHLSTSPCQRMVASNILSKMLGHTVNPNALNNVAAPLAMVAGVETLQDARGAAVTNVPNLFLEGDTTITFSASTSDVTQAIETPSANTMYHCDMVMSQTQADNGCGTHGVVSVQLNWTDALSGQAIASGNNVGWRGATLATWTTAAASSETAASTLSSATAYVSIPGLTPYDASGSPLSFTIHVPTQALTCTTYPVFKVHYKCTK